jgi:spore germination protein
MRRSLLGLTLAGALALAPLPAYGDLAVTGYTQSRTTNAVIERNAPGLTTLTVVGVSITADGRRLNPPPRDTLRLGRKAHREGLRAELLLNNWSNRIGGFDTRAAGRLLRSEENIRRVARQAARFVEEGGWDGVNLDLESLRGGDGAGLVRLAEELQARMPAEKAVSIDLSARGSVASYRAAGYRLGALADTVDVVQLMAYDEHGPSWSGPGPIGSLDWQRRSLAVLLQKVPREQVDLGVAGYGYTWPTRGEGRSVTVAGARELVREGGGRAVWKAEAGEWRAKLRNGTVVWWSDKRSYRLRKKLAREEGLHGLAVWRVGSADTLR